MIKQPHNTDIYVGQRIRMRRKELGISQTELGKATGVTFQQIQKVEKGSNRIAASRLLMSAQALNVDVNWFFGDLLDRSDDSETPIEQAGRLLDQVLVILKDET